MADAVIKSVRRVFEIFELFQSSCQPLSAKDVADKLGYPLASAHALMKSMRELGYVDFDSATWTYLPSRKFSALSDWLQEYLDRDTQLLECVEAVGKETRETINLSRLVGANVKIIHGIECTYAIGVSVKVGTLMPALESLTGLTALAALGDDELAAFLHRLEPEKSAKGDSLNIELIQEVKHELKAKGTVCRCDLWVPGIGAVCAPVQTRTFGEPMVIGVVGPSERITQHEPRLRRTLKRLMSDFGIAMRRSSGK